VLQDEATTLGALTYGELAARARRVAQGLIGQDVSPGDRVGVMLPTSVEFLPAYQGKSKDLPQDLADVQKAQSPRA
jgi:acyl-CoA synthetase (AMP-forming)/AMP-acid ligase II